MVDRSKRWREFASERASPEETPRRALIVGCASCVWDDVRAAFDLCNYHAIYCVKQMGIHWPGKFEVFVTLHPEAMDSYEHQRKVLGFPDGYQIVAPPAKELGMHGEKGNIARRVSYLWPNSDGSSSASSGIYGAKIALDDGFERAVLAGVPMTPEGGHFLPETKSVTGGTRGKVWTGCGAFEIGFNNALPYLMNRVKSMSGRTQKVLGAPTKEWLA